MTQTRDSRSRPSRRCRDDSGAAIVEFAFVSVLLLLLIFGIINFGLLLSFKQDMTRAAAEGARAGAVAASDDVITDTAAATDEAVRHFSDRFSEDGCTTAGMTCVPPVVATCAGSAPTGAECVTVELVYDYDAEPFIVPLPIISAFLPDEVRASSTARINQ